MGFRLQGCRALGFRFWDFRVAGLRVCGCNGSWRTRVFGFGVVRSWDRKVGLYGFSALEQNVWSVSF